MDTTTDQMSTEELRRDIASQRQDIGRDLEAIGDRLSPGRMADRTRERARRRAYTWRDRLMGTVGEARERVGEAMPSGTRGSDTSPSEMVSEKVEGSPLMAGMVAFGIGFIAGSIIPPSRSERDLARSMEPQLQQVASGVAETARSAGEHLAPAMKEEAEAVKEEAAERASSVAGTAKSEVSSAREDIKSSNP